MCAQNMRSGESEHIRVRLLLIVNVTPGTFLTNIPTPPYQSRGTLLCFTSRSHFALICSFSVCHCFVASGLLKSTSHLTSLEVPHYIA